MKKTTTTANPLEDQNYEQELPCVLVVTSQANMHIGYLKEQVGNVVKMTNCRRLWYWSGAAGANQIAAEGLQFPKKCKIPCPVEIQLFGVVEILPVTNKAKAMIDAIPVWEIKK